MGRATPTTEPTAIRVGDTISWTKTFDDFPATTYTLKYELVTSGTRIQIEASADGDDYAIAVAATTTVNWTAGRYHWESFAHDGNDRYHLESGVIDILPDFEVQTSGYDDRSHAKKVLDAIESLLEGKFTSDVESYTIAGRSLTKMSVEELLTARDRYRAEYNKELYEAGNARPRKIQVAFRGN